MRATIMMYESYYFGCHYYPSCYMGTTVMGATIMGATIMGASIMGAIAIATQIICFVRNIVQITKEIVFRSQEKYV